MYKRQDSAWSDPLTVAPSSRATSARPLIPAPPMPTKWSFLPDQSATAADLTGGRLSRIGTEWTNVGIDKRPAGDHPGSMPRSVEPPSARGLPAAEREPAWTRSVRTVLVVEDSPEYALLVAEMLREALGGGVTVVPALALASAVEHLAARPVDCVLLDLSLPDARGLHALQRIQHAAPELPVIVLSGRDDETLAVRAVQQGAQDYLVKRDVDERLLGRAIRYAVERKHAELQLAYLAMHDGLTGLANRALFMDRLAHATARAPRSGGHVAVLFADLDRFKIVNDSLGHEAGDRLLVQVADRLRELVRPSDTVARFGGDEFLVLCEDLDSEAGAVAVAQRLVDGIERPFAVEGREAFVGLSVGIAFARPGEAPEEVIRAADHTMYRAKRGHAPIEVFEPSAHADALRALELDGELHQALGRSELELHYQPLVELANGRVIAVEALLRWRHPVRGLLAPGSFIPIAEATGLILPIGKWVAAEACAQLARWRAGGTARDIYMSVNVSPVQLADASLPAALAAAIADAGLEATDLCIEITEGSIAEDGAATREVLRALTRLGVRLAVDDFGSGYSCFSALDRYPIDSFKVDGSFVESLGERPQRREMLAAILTMARALHTDVVVEGVEDGCQAAQLRELGCEAAQGFYFGHPEEPESIGRALALAEAA